MAASNPQAHANALLLKIGDADGVKELIEEAGADVEATDQNGATALMLAIEFGRLEVIQVLVDAKADVNAVDSRGKTALMRAAGFVKRMICPPTSSLRQEMTLLLLGANARVNMADFDGKTALMAAAEMEDATTLRLLLEKNAEVDATDDNGDTALLHASRQGMVENVQQLIDALANVETRNKRGMTALTAMVSNAALCSTEQTKLVWMLLDAGADVDSTNEYGLTALMIASSFGRADVVTELLSGGASVDASFFRGNTALMYAVECGHYSVVVALLQGGADPTVTNGEGKTVKELLLQVPAADMPESIFFRGSTMAASRSSSEDDYEVMSDADTISSDLAGVSFAGLTESHDSDFTSSLMRVGHALAQQSAMNTVPTAKTSQDAPVGGPPASGCLGARSTSSSNVGAKSGEHSAVVERSDNNDSTLLAIPDCDDQTNFPYHYAVFVSGDDVDRFGELVEGIASDPNVAKPVRLVRRTKSIERVCAAEYAHLLGYHDLGDYIGAQSSNQLSREAYMTLKTTEAVSVKLLEDPADFSFIYAVVKSNGAVARCRFLLGGEEECDEADEIDRHIQAEVTRDVDTRLESWTPLELACQLGYVQVVNRLLMRNVTCSEKKPVTRARALEKAETLRPLVDHVLNARGW